MRPSTLCAAALLLLVPSLGAAKDIRKETFESQGRSRTVSLYVPPSAQEAGGGRAPLLLLLHGAKRDGLSLVKVWERLARQEGIVLAAVDAADPAFWDTATDPPELFRDLVTWLRARYAIDERRVYLFGVSSGAPYGLFLALLESEYFAAGAVHGGVMPPGSSYVLTRAKRKIPILLSVGRRDRFFTPAMVRKTRETLSSHGFPVELKERPSVNHSDLAFYEVEPRRINQDAWSFLSQHRLAAEPRFEPLTIEVEVEVEE